MYIRKGGIMNGEWTSQIKRGTLEYIVLLLIAKEDRYGYELIQLLEKYPMLSTKESTIYPLLRRLLKNDYLESYWKEIAEGIPSRKYYRLTNQGFDYFKQLDNDWQDLMNSIIEIKKEL